ncbi:MAG TPA: hypothetical protein VLX59_02835 [Acidimicrobiales bacterium]|nr:hypothetical protein [Acidimicrobiales bacterium]
MTLVPEPAARVLPGVDEEAEDDVAELPELEQAVAASATTPSSNPAHHTIRIWDLIGVSARLVFLSGSTWVKTAMLRPPATKRAAAVRVRVPWVRAAGTKRIDPGQQQLLADQIDKSIRPVSS